MKSRSALQGALPGGVPGSTGGLTLVSVQEFVDDMINNPAGRKGDAELVKSPKSNASVSLPAIALSPSNASLQKSSPRRNLR